MKKATDSKVPQGTKANISGSKLENRVEYMIKSQLGIESKHASRTKETVLSLCVAISQERYASNVRLSTLLVLSMRNYLTYL